MRNKDKDCRAAGDRLRMRTVESLPGQMEVQRRMQLRQAPGVRAAALALASTIALSISSLYAPAARAADSQPTPPPLTPRTAAQIDLTGYWVSVVTEDWTVRMITPKKGDRGSIPLNRAGFEAMMRWEPGKDTSAADQCKIYGAAAIMRRPGRLHITWQDDQTLRIDFAAGDQTRLLKFADFLPPNGFATTEPPSTFLRFQSPNEPTLQGHSIASWTRVAQLKGFDRFGSIGTRPPKPSEGGSLMVLTTRLAPGYLQANGVPYSDQTVMTEYFDRLALPNGDAWLVVTTIVDDPQYLAEPYVTSTHLKREPDGSKWQPSPCAAAAQ